MTLKEKHELFEKIQKRINTKEFEEEAVAKLKDYIDKNFTNIEAIDFGDGKIFIVPTNLDTPIKVVFESEISDNPTDEDLFDLINKVKPI